MPHILYGFAALIIIAFLFYFGFRQDSTDDPHSEQHSNTPSMLWLWIDDARRPERNDEHPWQWAKSSKDAIEILQRVGLGRVFIISFDHDLGGDDTGMKVFNWIEEQIVMFSQPFYGDMVVHSANPVGRENIQRAIRRLYVRLGRLDDGDRQPPNPFIRARLSGETPAT